MLKLLKWVYELGVAHERRRVKLLISRHRVEKPEPFGYLADGQKDTYPERLMLWKEVDSVLSKLIDPMEEVEYRITDDWEV